MTKKLISFFHRKELYIALIATFILGILAHGFVFFNYSFSHDSLTFAFSNDAMWKISLGRFMQPVGMLIRGNIHTPWVIGMFSMLYISLTTYFLSKIFKIKKPLYIVGISGLLVTSSILTLTNATYMHEADSFMLALMLAVLSVYIFDKAKYNFLISSILLTMSLGFYQSYFQIALAIFVILIFLKVLNNEKLKNIAKYFGKVALTFIVAFILYYIIHKLTLIIFNIEIIDSYNSISNIYSILNLGIFRDIYDSVLQTMSFYFLGSTYNFWITTIAHALSAILIIILLIKKVIKAKLTKTNITLVIISGIAFIISLDLIYILSGGFTHHLMVYSICMPLILLIVLLDHKSNKILSQIGIVVVFITIYSNIIYANQVYLKKDLDYNSTQELFSRMVSDIEEIDGYIPKVTPVIFVGHLDFNPNYEYNKLFSDLNEMGLTSKQSITYHYTFQQFNDYIVNSPLVIIPTMEYNENKNIVEMPLYPNKGSIELIDDKVFVKLSNDNYTG